MSFPRYFVDNCQEKITLSTEDSHHSINVLRQKPGDKIEIVDLATEDVYLYEIVDKETPLQICKVSTIKKAAEDFTVSLLMATCKGSKNELIVEKATELNVKEIIFFDSKHSITSLSEKKLGRLSKISVSAASQAKRSSLPAIRHFQELNSALNAIQDTQAIKVLCALDDDTKHIKELNMDSFNSYIAVGPEGDFTEQEIKLLKESGFIPISLGQTTQRAETAAISGVSLLRALYML